MPAVATPLRRRAPRVVICFVLAALQCLVGILLIVLGFTETMVVSDYWNCADQTGSAYVMGVVHVVAAAFAMVAYRPWKDGGKSAYVTTYVVLCVMLAWPLSFHVSSIRCLRHIRKDATTESDSFYAVVQARLILGYFGHVLAAVGAGLAIPDLCLMHLPMKSRTTSQQQTDSTDPASEPMLQAVLQDKDSNKLDHSDCSVQSEDQCLGESQKSPREIPSLRKNKQPLQLPDARTHVQEAPATGEKVTVVTLPEATGIVYAVPEHSFVIRRENGAYVAPPNSNHLTAFFPTYTKLEVD